MPRILIAEDDAIQSALLQAAMADRGYEAVTVTNGFDAVRQLRDERFDIALLDFHLPDVDGLAAARLMHDMGGDRQHTRLIALTASPDQLALRQAGATDLSFDAVVSKLHGLPAVMAAIDAHLAIVARHRAVDDAARDREAVFHRALRRRRRLAAPLAAVPALAVSAALAFGLFRTAASLPALSTETTVVRHAGTLRQNTAAVVDAMGEVRLAEQAYLATGAPDLKARFYAAAEGLDRTLSSRDSLRADGMPGAQAEQPAAITDPVVRAMAEAVERGPAPNVPPAEAASLRPVHDWADRLAALSETAVLRGLDTIRGNVRIALLALGLGVACGVWSAVGSVRRRWREADAPGITMHAASGPGGEVLPGRVMLPF